MSTSTNNNEALASLYYPVSVSKFVVLSLVTLGIYELYWFYKNWKFVRERDQSGISPFWRAIFAPLWYPALMLDFRRNVKRQSIPIVVITFLSISYFLLAAIWRLPDPYWLMSFLAFVPIVPLVVRINALNRYESSMYSSNSSWKLRHLVLATFSVPLLSFVVLSSVGAIPSTQVTSGSSLWPHHRAYLEESGIVEADERIVYFYSEGFISIKGDGNLLTEHGVVSYWRDYESDHFYIEKADFSEISEISPEYGSFIESTSVTISRNDGSEFILLLSTEGRRDRLFIRELRGLIGR